MKHEFPPTVVATGSSFEGSNWHIRKAEGKLFAANAAIAPVAGHTD
jgi:hypothetical protein